jgi:hypothetical protein
VWWGVEGRALERADRRDLIEVLGYVCPLMTTSWGLM